MRLYRVTRQTAAGRASTSPAPFPNEPQSDVAFSGNLARGSSCIDWPVGGAPVMARLGDMAWQVTKLP